MEAKHFRCLRRLGIEEDHFEDLKGKWSDYFTQEETAETEEGGKFGEVRIVYQKTSGKRYALKLFRKPLKTDERERIGLMVYLYRKKHLEWPRSLVKYVSAFSFSSSLLSAAALLPSMLPQKQQQKQQQEALLMAPIDGISINNMVTQKRAIGPGATICYLHDIFEAIEFLHSNGVVHRDIHSGNIMVTRDGKRAVLLDLDFACKPATEECAHLCIGPATPYSTPPDLWCPEGGFGRQQAVAKEADRWFAGDIWAAASSFVSFITMHPGGFAAFLPYAKGRDAASCDANQQKKMKVAAQSALLVVLQYFEEGEERDLFAEMLSLDYKQRPTAKQVLRRLKTCGRRRRSSLEMPLSREEFAAALERGDFAAEESAIYLT